MQSRMNNSQSYNIFDSKQSGRCCLLTEDELKGKAKQAEGKAKEAQGKMEEGLGKLKKKVS
jgi:hypothetical protein